MYFNTQPDEIKCRPDKKHQIFHRHFLKCSTRHTLHCSRCLTSSFPYGISTHNIPISCEHHHHSQVRLRNSCFFARFSSLAHDFTVAAVVCRHQKSWMKFCCCLPVWRISVSTTCSCSSSRMCIGWMEGCVAVCVWVFHTHTAHQSSKTGWYRRTGEN